ncbi:uncharacterized protein Tco025E_08019 [Trypanosoma conorhini]|uniref:Uncharacterized protein n=1 Tax=Trypanosoma conorhini TaxID=83891 RepID=A0A422NF77_9TRYP|nr:uncharacterized protein Tco025E_08019 [Trypanosoma conorhini]RNF04099.1 hypothetical protein Tco025E_08019 [Trypanosoma conorhini]
MRVDPPPQKKKKEIRIQQYRTFFFSRGRRGKESKAALNEKAAIRSGEQKATPRYVYTHSAEAVINRAEGPSVTHQHRTGLLPLATVKWSVQSGESADPALGDQGEKQLAGEEVGLQLCRGCFVPQFFPRAYAGSWRGRRDEARWEAFAQLPRLEECDSHNARFPGGRNATVADASVERSHEFFAGGEGQLSPGFAVKRSPAPAHSGDASPAMQRRAPQREIRLGGARSRPGVGALLCGGRLAIRHRNRRTGGARA